VLRKMQQSSVVDKSLALLTGAVPRRVLERLFRRRPDDESPFVPLSDTERAPKLYMPGPPSSSLVKSTRRIAVVMFFAPCTRP